MKSMMEMNLRYTREDPKVRGIINAVTKRNVVSTSNFLCIFINLYGRFSEKTAMIDEVYGGLFLFDMQPSFVLLDVDNKTCQNTVKHVINF